MNSEFETGIGINRCYISEIFLINCFFHKTLGKLYVIHMLYIAPKRVENNCNNLILYSNYQRESESKLNYR